MKRKLVLPIALIALGMLVSPIVAQAGVASPPFLTGHFEVVDDGSDEESSGGGEVEVRFDDARVVSALNASSATIASINEATGIGSFRAALVLASRPFADIAEVDAVWGVGPRTLERLREGLGRVEVVVGGGGSGLGGRHVDIYLGRSELEIIVYLGDERYVLRRDEADDDTFKGPLLDIVVAGAEGSRGEDGVADSLARLFDGDDSDRLGRDEDEDESSESKPVLSLTGINSRSWHGVKVDPDGTENEFKLERRILIPAENASSSDSAGSPYREHMENAPAYPTEGEFNNVFWDDWGPVFYRGRTDDSARLWCIASDPGPTESMPMVRRSLVGDAGQRVQGFITKIGLKTSYILVNAFTYPTRPSRVSIGRTLFSAKPEQLQWRNAFYDMIYDRNELQGVMLFGRQSEKAFDMWNESRIERGLGDVRDEVAVFYGPHPSSARGAASSEKLAKEWGAAVNGLREVVTPDDEALLDRPNYGFTFSEIDYVRIPPVDLPEDAHDYPFIGDDSWGRNKGRGRHNNPVKRRGRLNLEFRLPGEEMRWITVTGRDPERPNDTPNWVIREAPPSRRR